MPPRAARPCSYPGCGILTSDKDGRCPKHPRPKWVNATQVKRMSGWKTSQARTRLFAKAPLCVECEKAGRVRLATIRDHIVPLAEGGAEDETNTQGLCDACHDVKSELERQRGVERAYPHKRRTNGS